MLSLCFVDFVLCCAGKCNIAYNAVPNTAFVVCCGGMSIYILLDALSFNFLNLLNGFNVDTVFIDYIAC